MKTCSRCKIEKSLEQFNKASKGRDGLNWWCKECKAESHQTYYGKNRKTFKVNRLLKYGLTIEQFDRLLEDQDYRCAICQRVFMDDTAPSVDHDHSCCPTKSTNNGRFETFCGRCVRGLLCTNCNVALGMFGDNIERLISAIKYLELHEPKNYLTVQDSFEGLNLSYLIE